MTTDVPSPLAAITAEHLAAADESALYELLHRVRTEIAARNTAAALTVCADLVNRERLTETTLLVFGTSEWDNGFFYSPDALEMFAADGTRVHETFTLSYDTAGERYRAEVDEVLTELSDDTEGLTSHSRVVIDLRTGTVTHS